MKASEVARKILEQVEQSGDGEVVIINEGEETLYFVKDIYADIVNQEKQIIIEIK